MSSISSENKGDSNSSQLRIDLLKDSVDRFSFFDSLSLNKRRELINSCISTLSVMKNDTQLNQEQIEQLKALTKLGINKAKGSALSNFFISILSKDYNSFTLLLKKLDKLLKIDAPAAIIANINTNGYGQQSRHLRLASQLLFGNHIYEKMLHYGHPLKEKEGEPLFRYTRKVPFTQFSDRDLPAKVEMIFNNKDLVIEFKSNKDQGGFEQIKINDPELTEEKLKAILESHEDADIIYPTKELTVYELFDVGILRKGENGYYLSDDFLYLDEGFVLRSESTWQTLKPTNHIQNPPETHQLEVVIYSDQDMPGIFSDQGHASIKLTTPSGEVYDVGFYPDPSIDTAMEFEKGVLKSPDPFTYIPTHALHKNTLTYSLTPKAFQEVIKKIENIQSGKKDDLAYHPVLKNCSAFARDIRDTALEHGATSNVLSARKFSPIKIAGFNALEQIAAFTALNFLTNDFTEPKKKDPKAHTFEHLKSDGIYLRLC